MCASSPALPKPARRFLRYFAGIAGFVLVALAATAGWCYMQMRGSLAQLDGERMVAGATAPIVIERDYMGHPTIRASSRADVSRGLGILHGQERQLWSTRRQAGNDRPDSGGRGPWRHLF